MLVIVMLFCLLPPSAVSAKSSADDIDLPLEGKSISVLGNSINNRDYVVKVETAAGNKELVEVKVSEKGMTVIRTAKDYVTAGGMIVNYKSVSKIDGEESTYVEKYTSTNKSGTYLAEGGSEKDVKKAAPVTVIDVSMIDEDYTDTVKDETVSIAVGREAGQTNTAGDLKTSDDDGIYDYIETSVIEQGAVSVCTHSVSISEKIVKDSYKGMGYIKNTTEADSENDMIVGAAPVKIPASKSEVPEITEGYDYIYLGSDILSEFWAAYAYDTPSENYKETPIYTDGDISLYMRRNHSDFTRRGLVVPKIYLKDKTAVAEPNGDPAKEWYPAYYDSIQQFTLCDTEGQIVTAYCADQKTKAVVGRCYKLVNLEDSTYYTADEARMIRTITYNGYWGTDSGLGSLDAVKEMMRASGKFTDDEISRLTEGMAMTATQYAIWTFSNAMDEITFMNAYEKTAANGSGPSKAADQEDVALIFKLYHYYTSMMPVPSLNVETTQKMVINDRNFLESISLSVKDKPEEHSNNRDEDDANDVYLIDVSFVLGVKPSTEAGDDLVLKITDEDGKNVAIGRIAGKAEPGEVMLTPDENGRYTFSDIYLGEGKENLTFFMEGTQHLDKAAQLFISEVKEGTSSQPMVAIMEGDRGVNIAMDISFDLDVKDEQVLSQHAWRMEKTVEPTAGTRDEDVYQTGDSSNMWLWFALMLISTGTIFAIILKWHKNNVQ